MTLTQQQRDGLAQKVTESELRPDAQARVLELLAQESLSADEAAEIQDLIQADIEADIDSVPGLGEEIAQDPEYQALVAETEREVAAIEKELAASMEVVEAETQKLDEALDQLDGLMTEARIDAVKGNLGV